MPRVRFWFWPNVYFVFLISSFLSFVRCPVLPCWGWFVRIAVICSSWAHPCSSCTLLVFLRRPVSSQLSFGFMRSIVLSNVPIVSCLWLVFVCLFVRSSLELCFISITLYVYICFLPQRTWPHTLQLRLRTDTRKIPGKTVQCGGNGHTSRTIRAPLKHVSRYVTARAFWCLAYNSSSHTGPTQHYGSQSWTCG